MYRITLDCITVGFLLLQLMKSDCAVDCRSGSLQLLCEGLRLIRAASPESVGVQVSTPTIRRFCVFSCSGLFTDGAANSALAIRYDAIR